jgi:hypothetical protein
VVLQADRWYAHSYAGFRPVACALVGVFRPHLSGCVSKHSQSGADKALPAIVLAVVAAVGSVGKVRLPLVRLLLRAEPGDGHEAARQRRAITQAGATLQPHAVLVVDAGFGVAALLPAGVPHFGARVARHFTARRQRPGAAPGFWGTEPPLPPLPHRQDQCRSPPEATAPWVVAGRRGHAQVWDNLGLATATPGAVAFRCVVIHNPRSQAPWVLATHLPVSA